MKYIATTAIALALAVPAMAEEVTLRGVTAFAAGTTFSRPFEAFVARVNETGAGVVQIEFVGGPEAVPTFELGNAVSTGIVDIANNTTAFYAPLLPMGGALKLATTTIQEQRANGCFEMIDAMHRDGVAPKASAQRAQ